MKKRDETKDAVQFGVVIGIAALLFAAWEQYKGAYTGRTIALAIGVPALLLPFIARPIWMRLFRLWMKLATVISFVMSHLILAILFYLVVTPMGLVMRLLGKRPLDVTFKDGRPSYWKEKPEGEYTLERYRKLY